MSPLENVQVVLARPSEPRNIGATCRAMKNAGVSRLVIATDTPPDLEAARPLAVNAGEILDRARVVATLEEAVRGSSLVAGITRRVGQKRKSTSFAPWELAQKVGDLGGGVLSVVFGNEQSGLSDDELEHCQIAVSIPASPDQPSLNLSHAVQVILYELYKAVRIDSPKRTHVAMPVDAIRSTVDRIIASLSSVGYLTQEGSRGTAAFFVDLLARASVSHGEAKRFARVFSTVEGICLRRATSIAQGEARAHGGAAPAGPGPREP